MKIVIAGGTGFLGRALSSALARDGHDVVVLTRGTDRAHGGVTWCPDGATGPWAAVIDGADAVVNLAGESIAAGRWSDARKDAIRQSRLLATGSLVSAILASSRPPRVLVSGSAQGFYGERGDEELPEDAGPGGDFLARVCVEWEAAARAAESVTRVVLLRTGIVLSGTEGALPRMLVPFRLFAGGPVGTGRQFVSWIHWCDWVGVAVWAIANTAVTGPVNLCAPLAVRNAELAAAVGRALGRPSWLPVPAFALRAALGEMADSLLLTSIRMAPRRALTLGYRFLMPGLDPALSNLLS